MLNRDPLSGVAIWYSASKPGGGTFRPFDCLSDAILNALRTGPCSEPPVPVFRELGRWPPL